MLKTFPLITSNQTLQIIKTVKTSQKKSQLKTTLPLITTKSMVKSS